MAAQKLIGIILLFCSLVACGQDSKKHAHQKSQQMEIDKITNKVAKSAIEAWQEGNSKLWLSFFTANAKLLDDGNPRNFMKFSTEIIGHEYFTSIDKVEDNGTSIYGHFHTESWGDFNTYFKFLINSEGKIYQLEIVQAE